jgi:hypothetical protein
MAEPTMVQLWGRRLEVAEQDRKLTFLLGLVARGRRLTPREAQMMRVLGKLKRGREYVAWPVKLREAA